MPYVEDDEIAKLGSDSEGEETELGLTDSEVRLGHSHWSRSTED